MLRGCPRRSTGIGSGWRAVYGHLIESGGGACGGGGGGGVFAGEGDGVVVVPFQPGARRGKGAVRGRVVMGAYQCEGPVVELRDFYGGEFFVSPIDLGWTFVVMGGSGGPYFLRS